MYLRNRPEPPATYMIQWVKDGVESGILYKRYDPDAVSGWGRMMYHQSLDIKIFRFLPSALGMYSK